MKVIFQTLLPPGETDRSPNKIRRTLTDRQIQPFDVGRVQISGIIAVLPSLFPSPRWSESGFAFDPDSAVSPSLLDGLAVETSKSQYEPDDLLIEFETIRGDHREAPVKHAGRKISKQARLVRDVSRPFLWIMYPVPNRN